MSLPRAARCAVPESRGPGPQVLPRLDAVAADVEQDVFADEFERVPLGRMLDQLQMIQSPAFPESLLSLSPLQLRKELHRLRLRIQRVRAPRAPACGVPFARSAA